MSDIKDLKDQLDRMEAKQDAFTERVIAIEVDHRWLKLSGKWIATILLAVVGKIAHLTFFKN